MKKRMKQLGAVILGAALLSGSLSACSQAPKGDTAAANQTEAAAAGAEASSSASGADRSAKLLIYSNSSADGKGAWVIQKAREAGFNIECVDIDGGDLVNRAIAEKNNQLADVVWGLNTMSYEVLKKHDLLQSYPAPAWTSDVDMSLADAEGYYYPIVVQPLILAYKTDVFTTETAPTDWVQVATSEEFKGKHNILSLGGGTVQSIIASILIRYRDESGELGISSEGWDVMKQYIQGGHVNTETEDWFANFTSGRYPITQIWGSGYFQRIKEQNLTDLAYAVPEIGVPYVTEHLGIFKGSKNPELAKEFIEWFGSPEIQGEFSEKFGTAPACRTALEKADPQVREMLTTLHPQEMDWKFVGEHREQWMEKIQLEFVE